MTSRLASAFGWVNWPASGGELWSRFETWRWPAVQMTVASALAYFAAGYVVEDSASYAPITAIVTIGLGRERRIERSGQMIAGLAFGVLIAELTSPFLGATFWEIGLVLGGSALLVGMLLDAELAVSYAAIYASLLIAIPGSEGWIPERVIAGAVGVAAAVAVVLLVLPPSPSRQVGYRLRRLAASAEEAADVAANVLRNGFPDTDEPTVSGDDRATIAAARRLDDEIERNQSTADLARQIGRWSPVRRWRGDDAGYLRSLSHDLRPALRTMSTIVRLSDRMLIHDVRPGHETVTAIEDVGRIAADVIGELVERGDLDGDTQGQLTSVLDRIRDVFPEHASEIAVHEELVGLVGDLRDVIAAHDIDGVPDRAALAVERHGIHLGPNGTRQDDE